MEILVVRFARVQLAQIQPGLGCTCMMVGHLNNPTAKKGEKKKDTQKKNIREKIRGWIGKRFPFRTGGGDWGACSGMGGAKVVLMLQHVGCNPCSLLQQPRQFSMWAGSWGMPSAKNREVCQGRKELIFLCSWKTQQSSMWACLKRDLGWQGHSVVGSALWWSSISPQSCSRDQLL